MSAKRLSRFSFRLVERIKQLMFESDIEACEVYSVLGALSWVLVLVTQKDYLSTSTRMHSLSLYAPTWFLVSIFSALVLYQGTCVLLGGVPSVTAETAEEALAWHQGRLYGMIFAVFVWVTLSDLVSADGLTVGTFLFAGFAVGSAWGAWRMSVLLAVDREVEALKRLIKYADSIGLMQEHATASGSS